jgi:hypothetical protein
MDPALSRNIHEAIAAATEVGDGQGHAFCCMRGNVTSDLSRFKLKLSTCKIEVKAESNRMRSRSAIRLDDQQLLTRFPDK